MNEKFVWIGIMLFTLNLITILLLGSLNITQDHNFNDAMDTFTICIFICTVMIIVSLYLIYEGYKCKNPGVIV